MDREQRERLSAIRHLVSAGDETFGRTVVEFLLGVYDDAQALRDQETRARTFREAARLLEGLGHTDDAVNVLDNVAAGIERELSADPTEKEG